MKTFNFEQMVDIKIKLWYSRNTAFPSSSDFNPSKTEGNFNLPMSENKNQEPLNTKDVKFLRTEDP